jgi:hypothetical protein
MQKVGGIWSYIIFRWILFEGADAESWRDLEPYNFQPVFFFRSGAIIFLPILFEGADEKVGGIWSHIILRRILFEGADPYIHSLWDSCLKMF